MTLPLNVLVVSAPRVRMQRGAGCNAQRFEAYGNPPERRNDKLRTVSLLMAGCVAASTMVNAPAQAVEAAGTFICSQKHHFCERNSQVHAPVLGDLANFEDMWDNIVDFGDDRVEQILDDIEDFPLQIEDMFERIMVCFNNVLSDMRGIVQDNHTFDFIIACFVLRTVVQKFAEASDDTNEDGYSMQQLKLWDTRLLQARGQSKRDDKHPY